MRQDFRLRLLRFCTGIFRKSTVSKSSGFAVAIGRPPPISPEGFAPTPSSGWRPRSQIRISLRCCWLPKHSFGFVIGSQGHQMPGGLGQLAGQRFGRNHLTLLSRFALIPPAALFIITAREIGRFDKRPGQILVAAFGVVLSLLLAVGSPLRLHRTAVAGEVAGLSKALDVAYLHRNGHAQYRSHSRQRRQLGVQWQLPRTVQHRLLNFLYALGQLLDVFDLHPSYELVGWMIVEILGLLNFQFLELAQSHFLAGGPRVETLEAEHQRPAVMDQAQSPPQQVAHWTQLFIVDVADG